MVNIPLALPLGGFPHSYLSFFLGSSLVGAYSFPRTYPMTPMPTPNRRATTNAKKALEPLGIGGMAGPGIGRRSIIKHFNSRLREALYNRIFEI